MLNTKQILFPDWYNALYEFECEAKGHIQNLNIQYGDTELTLTFYDSTRLMQDITDELAQSHHTTLNNIVIIPKVNKHHISNYLLSL